MESYLNENFDLTSKNPTDEALRRWRKLSGVVMNLKRRFPFTANLSKRMEMEAEARRRANQDAEYESVNEKKIARRSTSARRARAAEVHNLSERRRRDRINEKMRALQELIPHCNKSDKASMLDEAIEYLKSLQLQVQEQERLQNLMKLKDEEGGGEKKDEGGGDKGGGGKGGGGSEKDKPDDSEKKDKEGGGRAGEKKDKTSGELIKMGANKLYGGWFTFGPGTCAEAVVDELKQVEWLLTGFAFIVSVCQPVLSIPCGSLVLAWMWREVVGH